MDRRRHISRDKSMARALDKLRSTFGINDGETSTAPGFWESLDESTTLSRTHRLQGFAICFGFGCLFCIISMFFLISLSIFATFYTLGILSFVGSTFFLMGPWNQVKSMMKKHRLPATCAFLVCMCLTLWAAFSVGNPLLVIFFFVLQLIALLWYVLTYIPYGQQAASSFLTSMFS